MSDETITTIEDLEVTDSKHESSTQSEPQQNYYYNTSDRIVNVEQKNGMATAGGVLGIVGFVLGLIPLVGIWFGFILGVLAIIFSGIGLSKSSMIDGVGKGLAVTGLVLGIVTVIIKLIPGVNLL